MRKPAQVPLYRSIERLLLWAVPITERLPKSLPYQALGSQMLHDIRISLDAISAAMQTTDPTTRLQCVNVLISHMTAVKTTMRILMQCRYKQTPLISYKQEAGFLGLINPIDTQAGAWLRKIQQDAA
jgi:hypothetical protein